MPNLFNLVVLPLQALTHPYFHISFSIKMKSFIAFASFLVSVSAFPFVADMPGVDSSLYKARHTKRQQAGSGPGSAASCPFNANHVAAVPYSPDYPYNYAFNGTPGRGMGGFQVPAPGDDAHKFIAPGANDIRGPCPGLNAAANHGVC